MQSADQAEFVQLLTDFQPRLYAYIRSMVMDREQARDVLQNTNVALWSKSTEFIAGADFGAWACRFAYFQVMAWRRDTARDRHLFNEELLTKLSPRVERHMGMLDRLGEALDQCMEKLSDTERSLLRWRYYRGVPVTQIAEEEKRTPNAVSRSLFRVRRDLLVCLESALAKEVAQ